MSYPGVCFPCRICYVYIAKKIDLYHSLVWALYVVRSLCAYKPNLDLEKALNTFLAYFAQRKWVKKWKSLLPISLPITNAKLRYHALRIRVNKLSSQTTWKEVLEKRLLWWQMRQPMVTLPMVSYLCECVNGLMYMFYFLMGLRVFNTTGNTRYHGYHYRGW